MQHQPDIVAMKAVLKTFDQENKSYMTGTFWLYVSMLKPVHHTIKLLPKESHLFQRHTVLPCTFVSLSPLHCSLRKILTCWKTWATPQEAWVCMHTCVNGKDRLSSIIRGRETTHSTVASALTGVVISLKFTYGPNSSWNNSNKPSINQVC